MATFSSCCCRGFCCCCWSPTRCCISCCLQPLFPDVLPLAVGRGRRTSCKLGHAKMAHPSPDHSIGEDYAKMKAEPCKIVEHTLGDSRTHEKTMKNEAAQAKSEGQHIHGTFHTRQVHTSCKWGHTKMAHPSPDHSIGEDYAKMKAEPCKIVENTLGDSRTHEKTMKNEAAQAKSEGQHIHGTFHTRQVHTSCKWGHTKMAHTPLQTIQSGKTMQK